MGTISAKLKGLLWPVSLLLLFMGADVSYAQENKPPVLSRAKQGDITAAVRAALLRVYMPMLVHPTSSAAAGHSSRANRGLFPDALVVRNKFSTQHGLWFLRIVQDFIVAFQHLFTIWGPGDPFPLGQ